ncbi:MAG: dihydrodipicolinate synthase family protein [Clostridia bacterium]|nr:dihydrodipicolinate synthase family protein [Clostridia bacterium]
MSNIQFKGIMPALMTPLNEDGSIRRQAVKPLTDFALDRGVDGFYVCGSSGEGPVLSPTSRMEMAECAIEAVKGRTTVSGKKPVIIVHVASPDPLAAIELARHAEKIGADAISSLAPNFYFNYSEDELVAYYRRLAESTSLPLLVYATPMLKVGDLKKFIARLMEIDNVIGLKFTMPNYFQMHRVKELNGGDINVINGPDEMLLCGLVMGADGGIGTTYNVMPDKFSALYKAFTAGDIAEAQRIQYDINHVIDIILRFDPNNVMNSTKAVLNLMGFDVGRAVFPAREYTQAELNALRDELASVGFVV